MDDSSLFFNSPLNSEYVDILFLSPNDKGNRQKSSFLSGPATKAFIPPPPRLSDHRNFFLYIKKSSFSLVVHPFSPLPPLSGLTTKKITFFLWLP